jgi:DNA polymerase-3 subunit epsilon
MTAPALDLETMAATLAQSPDFKVLRKFVPRARYAEEQWDLGGKRPVRLAAFVDTETNGLEDDAEIIELGIVPFAYDAESGAIYDVFPSLSFFEEPKRAIPEEVQALTGITPAMVKGQRIDDGVVNELLSRTHLVFAHVARFDRPKCERRLPAFARLPWSCTQEEIEWRDFGVNGGALGNILMSACGEFLDGAHRAANDCQAGVHILATATLNERTAMQMILASAREGAHRVCAMYSPMEAKEALRGRKYRARYEYGRFCYWYKDVKAEDVEAESEWCRDVADAEPVVKIVHAVDRYSERA